MTRAQVVEALRAQNPGTRDDRLFVYTDALLEYAAAQANISEHGTIVSHPRTGAPIVNPYIEIRNVAAKTMLSLRLRSAGLW